MELTESIPNLNKRMAENFGIDTISSLPMWRVAWSEDQFEWRYGTYDDITPAGIYLKTVTEIRYVPKYRQWIQDKYVLERLVLIPEMNSQELPSEKLSYEPLHVFEDRQGFPLPPKWEAIQLIIKTVYAAQYGTRDLKRYVDPEKSQEESLELKRKRIDQIVEELYGDDSGLGGTTINCGESIIVPRTYERKS